MENRSRHKDLTGEVFGRLTVIEYEGTDKNRAALWRCRCECGTFITKRAGDLMSGNGKSCGCLQREIASQTLKHYIASSAYRPPDNTKHGMRRTRLYGIWCHMKRRCSNHNYDHYDRYGGRGIKVCNQWMTDFVAFSQWSISHGYDDTKQIDRIDNDGNYEPGNCRWVSQCEQVRNRSSTVFVEHCGVRKTLKEWADQFGVRYKTAYQRYKAGRDFEDIFALGKLR